ncbi:TPA: SGNH/GDSL hydrolase family protein, partial [Escherichia coli]
MNFNNVFRWHLPFLFLVLLTFRAAAADTLLILGDSLSAGYRMSASAAWPALLNDKWQSKTSVINASISGDTSQQGLAQRLLGLLWLKTTQTVIAAQFNQHPARLMLF